MSFPSRLSPRQTPMTWQAQDHEAPKGPGLAGMSVSELWKYTTLYARFCILLYNRLYTYYCNIYIYVHMYINYILIYIIYILCMIYISKFETLSMDAFLDFLGSSEMYSRKQPCSILFDIANRTQFSCAVKACAEGRCWVHQKQAFWIQLDRLYL